LFKKHWKTTYRDSPYNIQKREKIITNDENIEVSASALPEFDPGNHYDQLILREAMPSYSGVGDLYNDEHWKDKSVEEKRKELWDHFETYP
jgi:hypothetical protein